MLRAAGTSGVLSCAPGPASMNPLLLLALHAMPALADEAACPVSVDQLATHLDEAISAWNRKDKAGYLAKRDQIWSGLDCVDARLPASVAGDLHAIRALDGFASRQEDVATAALRSYAELGAGPPLDERLAFIPPGLASLLEQAAALPESASEPMPEGPTFWVDGQETSTWRSERVGVIQAPSASDDGRIWTDQIPLGGPLPTAPAWTYDSPPTAAGVNRRPGRGW